MQANAEEIYEYIIHFINGLNNTMFGQREYKFDIGNYLTDNVIELRKD